MEIDLELLEVFVAESGEQLATLEQSLLELEVHGVGAEIIQTIFRTAHTLKGNAACLGLTHMAESAHVVEDLLDDVRSGGVAVTPELITLLLRTIDAFRAMVESAATSKADEGQAVDPKLFHQIASFASAHRARSSSDERTPAIEPASELASEPPHDDADEPSTGVTRTLEITARGTKTLRVNVDKLDRMLDITSEIAIARGRLHELLKAHRGGGERVLDAYADLERLSLDLQEEVRRTRMVPVGPLFSQYRRITREVSAACGKQAALSVRGEEVEVDTSVIELLRDPLTHMIRNAIDHGIEPTDVRRASGKAAVGSIELVAYHDGGSVVILVRDDGAGIDSAKIANKARKLGLIKGELPKERELLGLIFEPGFSTTEAVTELSGRGVGMDVVRRNVEALRGTIAVDTQLGAGTTITIRLPLTLAIIDGLSVSVGDETYIVPVDVVSECVDGTSQDDVRTPGGLLQLRDEALPCVDLRHALGARGPAATRPSVVVVTHDGSRAGLLVDALLGQAQAVVKPLGQLFRRVSGISGSTILGNGRVALILDVATLLRDASQREQEPGAKPRGRLADARSRGDHGYVQ